MDIEAVRDFDCEWETHPIVPVTELIDAREGVYERKVASILAVAAAWSYADIDTFSRVIGEQGIGPHQTVKVSFFNPVLLVRSTAYMVQSADRRLAILCFRGTEPTNMINWVADMSARMEPLFSVGDVHGGFLRTTYAIWPVVLKLLNAARGGSICEAARQERDKVFDCFAEPQRSDNEDHSLTTCAPPSPEAPEDKLEALYITGHSLGGAMAVIAATLLYQYPYLRFFQEKLRGVYTFGQPMVGLQDFADRASEYFGHKLFRCVHGNDVMARMPPRSTGKFVHFGREYKSTEHGWMRESAPPKAATWAMSALSLSLLEWVQNQTPEIKILQRFKFGLSIRDHGPIYYLRTSRIPVHGVELL